MKKIFTDFNVNVYSIHHKILTFNIIDIPGQNKFNYINKLNINKLDVIIIMCSLCSKMSIRNVNFWLDILKKISVCTYYNFS